MRRRARVLGRVVAVALVGASVGASIVTIRQITEVRAEQSTALAATTDARAGRAALEEELDRLELAAGIAVTDARRDHRDAAALGDATTELERLRARVTEVQRDVDAKTAESRARQRPIDLLVSCQRSLESAAAALAAPTTGDQAGAAVSALEGGRAHCQEAMASHRGSGSTHPYDFADPFVLANPGLGYFGFATNGPAGTVQVLASLDLRTWTVLDPALTAVPFWAEPGFTWAPAVTQVPGGWVLHYTVRERDSQRQCITVAVSASPAGPYVDRSWGPLVCQKDRGGSIDPSPYRDELGFLHLTWKSEGEVAGDTARIWTQALRADGRGLVGEPTVLLTADQDWERKVIENPSMARIGGRWFLLYSGNRWNSADYAVAHAECASAIGPCSRPEHEVVLRTSAGYDGPGGAAFFAGPDGATMVSYAAWDKGRIGHPNARRLHIAEATLTPFGLTIG